MWIPMIRLSGFQNSKHFNPLNHLTNPPGTILPDPMGSLPPSWLHMKNQDFFGHFAVKFC